MEKQRNRNAGAASDQTSTAEKRQKFSSVQLSPSRLSVISGKDELHEDILSSGHLNESGAVLQQATTPN